MFEFTKLKQLHLEITNNCQASCPMCSRNNHGLLNPNVSSNLNSWSIDDYKKIISLEVLNQVPMIYFCGNYGDPLLNNDLIEMIEYSVNANPNIEIRIHTNGSLRSQDWWNRLAQVMPKEHTVVFALDGLEDTQAIYRIGTNYNKIIENAKSFISAGGRANWTFIRFKHNEHQVEEAQQRAIDLGFEQFVLKDSSRWLMEPKFPVYGQNEKVIYNLEPSQYSEIKIIDNNIINNYETLFEGVEIDCHAKHTREAYIDAFGNVFPCCWIGAIPYHHQERHQSVKQIRKKILNQYNDLITSFGGIDKLNAIQHSVKDIINSNNYQSLWNLYWKENKLLMCTRICGKKKDLFSTPNDQFIQTKSLNND